MALIHPVLLHPALGPYPKRSPSVSCSTWAYQLLLTWPFVKLLSRICHHTQGLSSILARMGSFPIIFKSRHQTIRL